MSERKITIKPYSGSLGLRVFLISLALLILPLFLHTFFLYQTEYRQKLNDVQLTIRIIGEGQKALLEERILAQKNILSFASSDFSELKESFNVFEMPFQNQTGEFVKISPDGQFLWVGEQISKKKFLVIATPLSEIFDQLVHFEEAPYPISIAFLGQEGAVLAGEKQNSSLNVHFPIEGAEFSLWVAVEEKPLSEVHWRSYLFRFISFFFFVGILGGYLVWVLMRRVSRPLQSLCSAMQRVGEGALHVRYTRDWMGFEINALGEQFNQMIDSVLYHIGQAEKEKLARERLAQELKIAHEIQVSLLPSHFPQFQGIDIGHGFLPAREVGGDFYDIFVLENGSIFIAIADTAGKGISACLYSLGLRSILRSLATLSSDLSEIVLRANDLFFQDAKNSGMFVTLWAAIYDPKNRTLVYCSQGHPPAVLVRDGKEEELWTAGISLGAQTLDIVTVKTKKLKPQDLLFLYTDGIIEAHNKEDNFWGRKRLFEVLLRFEKLPVAEIIDKILGEISHFSEDTAQHDDIAMLSIRID